MKFGRAVLDIGNISVSFRMLPQLGILLTVHLWIFEQSRINTNMSLIICVVLSDVKLQYLT